MNVMNDDMIAVPRIYPNDVNSLNIKGVNII